MTIWSIRALRERVNASRDAETKGHVLSSWGRNIGALEKIPDQDEGFQLSY